MTPLGLKPTSLGGEQKSLHQNSGAPFHSEICQLEEGWAAGSQRVSWLLEKPVGCPVPVYYLIADCTWHRCPCQAKHGGPPQPTLGGHSSAAKNIVNTERKVLWWYLTASAPSLCLLDLWVSAVNLNLYLFPSSGLKVRLTTGL